MTNSPAAVSINDKQFNNFRPNLSAKYELVREPKINVVANMIDGVYGFVNVPNFWNVVTAYTIIAVIAVTCESDVNTVLIISPFNAARLSRIKWKRKY